MKNDLNKRLFEFAVDTIKYCRTLEKTKEYSVIEYQLIKAGTSSGSNYEESQAASSRAEFKYKIDISLREMREASYWLKILRAIGPNDEKNTRLIRESEELKRILGSISSKISQKQI